MGAIIVNRNVVGRMSAAVFFLGVGAFLLGFVHPFFFPFACVSLLGGGFVAVLIRMRAARTSHPSVAHLSPDPADDAMRKPIQPR